MPHLEELATGQRKSGNTTSSPKTAERAGYSNPKFLCNRKSLLNHDILSLMFYQVLEAFFCTQLQNLSYDITSIYLMLCEFQMNLPQNHFMHPNKTVDVPFEC